MVFPSFIFTIKMCSSEKASDLVAVLDVKCDLLNMAKISAAYNVVIG